MIIKEQNLVLIGRPLKNYSLYYDPLNNEIIQERDGLFFMIAGKNEQYSLLRKLVAAIQKYYRKKHVKQ